MRVTAVEMYSATFEEAITFSLVAGDQRAQYHVRTILGLDADELVPKFYGWSIDGANRYYDFGMKPRDIVMRVVLNPRIGLDESYSDIRDRLYRAISSNRTGQVVLHFKSGGTLIARILGSIIKFEATHFTNLPEVQVTIRCNDPMFKAINPIVFAPAELATTNPILIPDSLSTAPHGFTFQVTFTATAASFTIQDVQTTPTWKWVVTPSGGFLSGDVLYFSSEHSNRYIYMIRGGSTTTQLADKITSGSLAPIIFPGQNSFWFVNKSAFNWNSVEYYPSYWGV